MWRVIKHPKDKVTLKWPHAKADWLMAKSLWYNVYLGHTLIQDWEDWFVEMRDL